MKVIMAQLNLFLRDLYVSVKILALSFTAYKDMVTMLKSLRLRCKAENGAFISSQSTVEEVRQEDREGKA